MAVNDYYVGNVYYSDRYYINYSPPVEFSEFVVSGEGVEVTNAVLYAQ